MIIKHYRIELKYSAGAILYVFPQKNWSKDGLKKLIRKIDEKGSSQRRKGIGRPLSALIQEDI